MADNQELIQQILDEYNRKKQADKELQRLRDLIKSGKATWEEATQYAYQSAMVEMEVFQQFASDTELGKIILDPLTYRNYQHVSNYGADVQKMMDELAGIGFQPIIPGYKGIDPKLMDQFETVEQSIPTVTKTVVNISHKIIDTMERENADFQNRTGIKVTVTRIYDNVGVHTTDRHGGKPCKWCLERCGTDVPYKKALAMGMFQRHPGCGCTIIYTSGKKSYVQSKRDWEHNDWGEADPKRIESILKYNLNLQQFGKPGAKRRELYKGEWTKISEKELYRAFPQDTELLETKQKYYYYSQGGRYQIFIDKTGNYVRFFDTFTNDYVTIDKINRQQLEKEGIISSKDSDAFNQLTHYLIKKNFNK